MFEIRQRVIYADTDQMKVVYHANYFRYFESARNELLRAQGWTYKELEASGFMLPVVEATAHYKAPARYDDVLLIGVDVCDVRRVSFGFSYAVRREADGQVLCTGKTVHACIAHSGKPTKLPPLLAELVERLGSRAVVP